MWVVSSKGLDNLTGKPPGCYEHLAYTMHNILVYKCRVGSHGYALEAKIPTLFETWRSIQESSCPASEIIDGARVTESISKISATKKSGKALLYWVRKIFIGGLLDAGMTLLHNTCKALPLLLILRTAFCMHQKFEDVTHLDGTVSTCEKKNVTRVCGSLVCTHHTTVNHRLVFYSMGIFRIDPPCDAWCYH